MATDEASVNRGIYQDFPGYRLPTEETLDAALQTALVVVDANLLLNLYRYTETTRDDLLRVLRQVDSRLWVPHQVMSEFWRNRMTVISGRDIGTQQIVTGLDKQCRAAVDSLHQWAKLVGVDTASRDALIQTITSAYEKVIDTVRERTPATSSEGWLQPGDLVLQQLEQLLDGRVGAPLSDEEWAQAVAEGRRRVAAQQPPGFRDAEKTQSDLAEGPAGDYLVWHQTIQEASRRGVDVLFVTGDEKEDWWWRHRSQLIGPRVELVKELYDRASSQLFMLRPTDLLKRATTLAVSVSRASVDDAERVSREGSDRPLWTESATLELLERLENEGWPHADVIRAAALNDGRITRERVYEICNYEDDRMLRGFTRPPARITAELVSLGMLDEGVEPALSTVYEGGVLAKAFRIPHEMVAIIA